jgi:EPTP domain-containing protein
MLNSRRILLKRAGGAASVLALASHVFSKPTAADAPTGPLELVQTLATSGARAVAPYWIGGNLYLAVPQLAEDIPGGLVGMNFGDSDRI